MTATLGEVLAQYIGRNDFSERIELAYNALDEARPKPCIEHHGVGLIVRMTDEFSLLDRYTRNRPAYNGRPHSLMDSDISDVIAAKRHEDGAVEIDTRGFFVRKHVKLPMETVEYADHFGIDVDEAEFLGYSPLEEPPGTRASSALYATLRIPDIAIVTLGENDELNVYWRGDRIFNSAGRDVKWHLADRVPEHRSRHDRGLPYSNPATAQEYINPVPMPAVSGL